VFIWGGATSIGWHAIQLAKLIGLKVLTVASSKHHDTLREIGADEVFDYNDADVLDKLKKTVREWGNVKYGFDGISENGTIENSIDVLAETPGGAHLVTVLPPNEAAKSRNANVQVTHTLGYTFFGEPFTFARKLEYPVFPEHVRILGEYFHSKLPLILDGWVEGRGSQYFRAQKLRVIEGGLEQVGDAMKTLQEGKVSGEKLIVRL